MTYAKHFGKTAQTSPIPLRDMEKNPAGGYGFKIADWQKLNRFLMLGSELGTYYEGERQLTIDNASAVLACIKEDGRRVVREASRISDAGEAPSNSPAIFVLALCFIHGDLETRLYASDQFGQVIRIGTHLYEFLDTFFKMRGKGKGLNKTVRRAVTAWIMSKRPRDFAYQMTKYAQRDGWANIDLIRLLHAKAITHEHEQVMLYALNGDKRWLPTMSMRGGSSLNPTEEYLLAVNAAKDEGVSAERVIELIQKHHLPREVIRTELLNNREIWTALLQDMPYTATMRNLPKMTELGLLERGTETNQLVMNRLRNVDLIKKGRVHPLALLIALKTYASGQSVRGEKRWSAQGQIIDALDDAFYASFEFVEEMTQSLQIGIDLSGSMSGGYYGSVAGIANLSPAEASVAAAMVYRKSNPNSHIMGFATGMKDLDWISHRQRLDDIMRRVSHDIGGGTDCSQVFKWAEKHKYDIDAFLMFTDSMTWAGSEHPSYSKTHYRDGKSKWVLFQTTATGTSIQDPEDMNSMEFAGFSPGMFSVTNEFIKGNL